MRISRHGHFSTRTFQHGVAGFTRHHTSQPLLLIYNHINCEKASS